MEAEGEGLDPVKLAPTPPPIHYHTHRLIHCWPFQVGTFIVVF